VFVQNLAPGAAERVGLGAEALRAKHPRLIVCGISGYGTTGPFANRKAYDLLIQSEVGLLSITGTEREPCKVGISIADIAAGMYAYSGILTAIIRRQQTNAGSIVHVSMFEALAEWMGYPAYYTRYSGQPPPRAGASHAAIAPYGPFETGDGKTVYLAVQNEREWVRFCQVVLGNDQMAADPRFTTNARRVEHRADLHSIISRAFERLPASDILALLDEAQIANAQMNSVQGFLDHPQLAARGRWCIVDSPVGALSALKPPVDMDGVHPVMGGVPAVGQHTDSILAELGFDPRSVEEWRERGVV
jgi:formyl-CoA transferase